MCGSPKYFERHGVRKPRPISKNIDRSIHRSLGLHLNGSFAMTCGYPWMRLYNATPTKRRYQSARDGWGLTRFSTTRLAQRRAGELQIILSEFEEPPLPIHILHPEVGTLQQRFAPSSIWQAARLRENGY